MSVTKKRNYVFHNDDKITQTKYTIMLRNLENKNFVEM